MMKKHLMKTYKVLRSIVVTLLLLFVFVYGSAYLVLSIPSVQRKAKEIGERELSKLLSARVSVGAVSVEPFSEVGLKNVVVGDSSGVKVASIEKLGAKIDWTDFLLDGRFVFNYAELIGLDARLSKVTPDSKLNIQFIIDALSPKNKKKEKKKYDVELEAVAIRKSRVTFDVLSEAHGDSGKFDKNHISISHLRGDIIIPKIKNDSVEIDIKRFAFMEQSGFILSDLTMNVNVYPDRMSVKNLKVALPNSLVVPEDIDVSYESLQTIGTDIKKSPLSLVIVNSYVNLSDFSAFVPELKNLREPVYITCSVKGNMEKVRIETIDLSTENEALTLKTSGYLFHVGDKKRMSIVLPNIRLHSEAGDMLEKVKASAPVKPEVADIISAVDFLTVNGSLTVNHEKIFYAGSIATALGSISTNMSAFRTEDGRPYSFRGEVGSKNLKLGKISKKEGLLNELSFSVKANLNMANKRHPKGSVNGKINYIDLKGYRYSNILADLSIDGKQYDGSVILHDENANIDISGSFKPDAEHTLIDVVAKVDGIDLNKLNLSNKYPDHKLGGVITAAFTGNNLDNIEGDLLVSDIRFRNEEDKGVRIDHFDVTFRKKDEGKYLTVNSDVVNGYIEGKANFAGLGASINKIVSGVFPALSCYLPKINEDPKKKTFPNSFTYFFQLAENNELTSFFKLPVTIVHPIKISGVIDDIRRNATLGIDAPYIVQGKKVIEKTSLSLNVDGGNNIMSMNAVTQLNHKNGNILLVYNGNGASNRFDSDINWHYDRKRNFSGKVSLSTSLCDSISKERFIADVKVNPTTFSVNDTIWHISPANIDVDGKEITVDGVHVFRDNQFVKINGKASPNPDDVIKLQLSSIDLGYIFETLKINHVAFSGEATGDFYASSLFTKTPKLNTPKLHVKNFCYHKALLGEAVLNSSWDNETKGIMINADISQPNKRKTYVRGGVYLGRDSLGFKFITDRVNVKILKPFMAAFTSDITGEASGTCELYGTFKNVNVRGRMFAHDFRMKVDFTNSYYTVSDSVILEPGKIIIRPTVIHDDFGNTATLKGEVTHDYFHNANFDFAVTNARNMLVYNTNEKINPFWYGRVFANGSAYIQGVPGKVNIDINMAAAPKSSFTFVLSDKEEAGEYSFITFTDKRKEQREKEEQEKKPKFLNVLKQVDKEVNPSLFDMNLQLEANPNVDVTLVMDPEGGDKIRATGSGNLQIKYSTNEEMKMFGNYTVESGRYNFTLQDIILREFTIRQGATISFQGDPLKAVANLTAAYSTNANLQDLDESFAEDRDLNRTLVPVNALLYLTGVISQPEIAFDLEFPTLTQDVYRKVKSIISTDDMMNQQIIYLLALSRFYTPEYMGGQNHSNELASVASSTISSQLTNMLGQISDKWTIAPNFHTDKGDFSDMEVELALSSRLLNNRLLLNGNFGYSDNAMNNNNFIGDFDIEYLLTKSGNFRLKAYNRYNDQNYYIRNSLTTQGVGIMFKHDFDSIFKRKKRNKNKKNDLDTDSVPRN